MKCTVFLLVALLCLCSCKTQYIPVETVRTEYQNQTDTEKLTDSIFRERETVIREADSATLARLGIALRQNERAVLVLQRELERERSRQQEHSTNTVIRNDTIRVPVPVEKPLGRWEQLCVDYGKVMIGFTAAAFVALAAVIVIWLRRKGLF